MRSRIILSALLLGVAAIAATPSDAARFERPAGRPHARFVFHHSFRHFTPAEHRWWVGGHWRHANWHGRVGWWWGVGGAWYFYPAPIYPYPEDVSPTYYDDGEDADDGGYQGGYDQAGPGDQGGGPGVWYHCASPEGYYPYVRDCKGRWEQVPATPGDMQGGPQGGPDGGPPPDDRGQYRNDRDNGDDQGPPPPPGR